MKIYRFKYVEEASIREQNNRKTGRDFFLHNEIKTSL